MAVVTETTPLLPERQDGSSQQRVFEQEARETTILKTLGNATLFLSPPTLLLIIGNYVIDNTTFGPIWYFTWYSEDAVLSLAAYMFYSMLLSAINGLINIHTSIIMIADVIFSLGLIQAAVRLFGSVPWSSNGLEDSPPTLPSEPRAMPLPWVVFVKTLMGTLSVLGLAVGALYATMFIIQIREILKTKLWERFRGTSPSNLNSDFSRRGDLSPGRRVQGEEA